MNTKLLIVGALTLSALLSVAPSANADKRGILGDILGGGVGNSGGFQEEIIGAVLGSILR